MSYKLVMIKKLAFVFLFVLTSIGLTAQIGIPYIKSYSHKEYKGYGRSYSIVEDIYGRVLFANEAGIIRYDGSRWETFTAPNNRKVRALCTTKDGDIYWGSQDDFGKFSYDSTGNVILESLLLKVPKQYSQFGEVWKIAELNGKVYFYTFKHLYIWDNEVIEIIPSETTFFSLDIIQDKIYLRQKGLGLFKFEDNKLTLIPGSEDYSKEHTNLLVPIDEEGSFLIADKDGMTGIFNGKEVVRAHIPFFERLKNKLIVYIKKVDNYYAIGTLQNGLYITDNKFKLIWHLNKNHGLPDVSVVFISHKRDGSMWITQNNYHTYINLSFPYFNISSKNNISGSGSCVVMRDSILYCGNSTGIYSSDLCNVLERKFNAVENGTGHIYYYMNVDGHDLFGGHDGLFELKNGKITKELDQMGVWGLCPISNNPGYYLMGTYFGLELVKYEDEKYVSIRKFKAESCRFLLEDPNQPNTFWFGHPYRGVYKATLSKDLTNIDFMLYGEENGLLSNNENYTFLLKDKMVICTLKGVYKYDATKDRFIKNEEFNYLDKLSLRLIKLDKKDNIWFATDKKVGKIIKDKNGNDTIEYLYPLGLNNKLISGFEYIDFLEDNTPVFGVEDGFLIYKDDSNKRSSFKTHIAGVTIGNNLDENIFYGNFVSDNKLHPVQVTQPSIKYDKNSIRFDYTSTHLNPEENILFTTILEGYQNEWSNWDSYNRKEYTSLSPGRYTFKVQAKNIYGRLSEVCEYKFEIEKPWYKTVFAFIGFGVVSALFFMLSIHLYTKRLRRLKNILEIKVYERTAEIQEQKEEISAQADRLKEINEELISTNDQVTVVNSELSRTNVLVTKKNKIIEDSLSVAQRIQNMHLPQNTLLKKRFKDSFVLYRQRDVVSGDFYWMYENESDTFIICADCSGHGVPGALLSLKGISLLNQIIITENTVTPSEILYKLDKLFTESFEIAHESHNEMEDSIELSIVKIDKVKKEVSFSMAGASVLVKGIDDYNLFKDSSFAIGTYDFYKIEPEFKDYNIALNTIESIYMFSDGMTDQFGGPKNRKFGKNRLVDLLKIEDEDYSKKLNRLNSELDDWMGDQKQIDDITVIGIKLN